MSDAVEVPEAGPDEPKGFGGWLILPLIHVVFGPVYLVWLTVTRGLPDIAARAPQHIAGAKIALVLFVLPFLGFQIFCLVRFLQKRREVPWLMTILYGGNILVLLVTLIALWKGYTVPIQSMDAAYATGSGISLILQLGVNVAYLAYFHDSVRVKNTFVNAAQARPEPKGLGGWLILPLAAVIVTLVVTGIAIVMRLSGQMAFAYRHHDWVHLLRQIFGILLVVGYPSASLYFVFRRKRAARWLLMIYFGLWTALCVHIVAKETVINPAGVVVAGLSLAGVAYFWLSKRVRNTFIS